MAKENLIQEKSYQFALKAIQVYKTLIKEKEFVISKQFLRSATSIGANIAEGIQAQSKKDFIHKLSISQKEAFETHYWIRLLKDAFYLDSKIADDLLTNCEEIQKILTAIIKTSKNNLNNGK